MIIFHFRIEEIVLKIYDITYFSFETKYLHERCGALLQRFYDYKDHQKKQIQSGGYERFLACLDKSTESYCCHFDVGVGVTL